MTKIFLTMLCLLLSLGLTAAPADKKPKKQKTGQLVQTPVNTPAEAQSTDNSFFVQAETMPAFEGGTLTDFYKWVNKTVKYPEELAGSAKTMRLVIAFIVEADGQVTSLQATFDTPSDSPFLREAQKVILSSPKWTPGMQKGKAVRVRMAIPVDFRE